MTDESTRPHLQEIDGLRGILAVWVLLYHVLTISGAWLQVPVRLQSFIDGGKAVDVFIILSGFVITSLLIDRRERYAVYIFRRFVRLYPCYAVCITVALIFQQLGTMPLNYLVADLPKHLFAHALMLHGVVPQPLLHNPAGAILNPAWSVSLEWQFYLLAPLSILFFKRGFIGVAGATVLCIVAYRVVAPSASSFGFTEAFLPFKIQYFWVGAASFFAVRNGIGSAALSLPLLGALMFISYTTYFGLVVWLLFLFIMTYRRSILSFLKSPLMLWLGSISYPVYLVHEPIIWSVKFGLGTMKSVESGAVTLVVALPASLLLAHIIHRWIEAPSIRWGRKYSAKWQGLPPAATEQQHGNPDFHRANKL